ncbi:hypothetical protein P7K49_022045 [Saguinus oedipus]|uniref:Uncharacterized protein n=1 Tax=Saguinus oedipus TaxID=9490 RepID=A0ABQ9UUD9_SAGOE|nr:hypothetical protein P7K49_022045 [Saguinus oedipus]
MENWAQESSISLGRKMQRQVMPYASFHVTLSHIAAVHDKCHSRRAVVAQELKEHILSPASLEREEVLVTHQIGLNA